MKSLLEQLPSIVSEGKREAERVMERAESNYRLGLQTRELVIPSRDSNWHDLLRKVEKNNISDCFEPNKLIYGDNMLAMASLLAGSNDRPSMRDSIDLIYIDPPFDSKADYRTKLKLSNGDIEQLPTVIEQFAYSDTWSKGTASYISMITPRLVLMRELLSPTGSIFVHIDWHVGHYLKIVMDEIFGRDNFVNDIAWCYQDIGSREVNYFKRKHDSIVFYQKSGSRTYFKPIRKGLSDSTIKRFGSYFDEDGRITYRWLRDNNPGVFRKLKGVPEDLDEAWLDKNKGQPMADWWIDISPLKTHFQESLGYPTQKPEALIQNIITSSCPEGGIVADFFAGSGTTAAVAERMGMRWIASDLGKPACMVTRKRLIDQDARPFLFQHIGDYQVEQMRSTMGAKFRIGDLAEIVLGLFGALPLPVEENPNKNMGRLHGSKTLVLADSPNKMTGLTTLRRALEIRDNLMGGWDKVIVLGWNFSPTIGHDIEALGQGDRLEVLVIPPDLLDRLKKKGHKLKADEVRFSSLQYLKLGEVKREQAGDGETLSVDIANYVLLSPEALNLDDANRDKLQKVINADPMALIEYWSVDPDYDGEVFRSVWQDYRGNTENDDDPYRVITKARLTGLPKKDGKRRVCVRVVDVFGFEAEATVEVA